MRGSIIESAVKERDLRRDDEEAAERDQYQAQKNPQLGEDEAVIVSDGTEDNVGSVAGGAFEVAATKVAVGLHVADGGFDGGTASQFAFDSCRTRRASGLRLDAARVLGVVAAGRDLGIEPLPVNRAGEPHRLVLFVDDLIDPGLEQIAFARRLQLLWSHRYPPTRPRNHDSRFLKMQKSNCKLPRLRSKLAIFKSASQPKIDSRSAP
jgi:hypothetical protein